MGNFSNFTSDYLFVMLEIKWKALDVVFGNVEVRKGKALNQVDFGFPRRELAP